MKCCWVHPAHPGQRAECLKQPPWRTNEKARQAQAKTTVTEKKYHEPQQPRLATKSCNNRWALSPYPCHFLSVCKIDIRAVETSKYITEVRILANKNLRRDAEYK